VSVSANLCINVTISAVNINGNAMNNGVISSAQSAIMAAKLASAAGAGAGVIINGVMYQWRCIVISSGAAQRGENSRNM